MRPLIGFKFIAIVDFGRILGIVVQQRVGDFMQKNEGIKERPIIIHKPDGWLEATTFEPIIRLLSPIQMPVSANEDFAG